MRRSIALLLAALLLIGLLSGCGSGAQEPAATPEPTPESTPEPTPEPTEEELSFWEAERLFYEELDYEGAYRLMSAVEEPTLGAMLALMGDCNYLGVGTRENNDLAYRYYSQAAELGDGHGEYGMGMCTYFGYGVRKDEAAGAELLARSCETMVAQAEESTDPYTAGRLYTLAGRCFYYGLGVEKDQKQAEKLLLKGAEYKNPDAEGYLGSLYYDRGEYARALEHYCAAADLGDRLGATNAGLFYYYGFGTETDYALAVHYLELAVERGDTSVKAELNKAKAALAEQEAAAAEEEKAEGGEG